MFSRRGADRASEMADVQYREAVQQIRELCRYLRFIYASEEQLTAKTLTLMRSFVHCTLQPQLTDGESYLERLLTEMAICLFADLNIFEMVYTY